jgi:hypothetical protein
MNYKIVTLAEQPGLADDFWPQKKRIWPEFMLHDVYADKLWPYLTEVAPH